MMCLSLHGGKLRFSMPAAFAAAARVHVRDRLAAAAGQSPPAPPFLPPPSPSPFPLFGR